MKLDFLEIGTCEWDTIIETVDDNVFGMSIEPIEYYLNKLPNKKNVIKLNAAIVTNDYEQDTVDVYYIDHQIIDENKLGGWLKGCNSIYHPHDMHLKWHSNPGLWHEFKRRGNLDSLNTRNLVEENLVSIKKVRAFTFEKLIKEFEIEKITTIKVDAEGFDCRIVNDILDFYENSNILPNIIEFEANAHTSSKERKDIIERLSNNYNINFKGEYDHEIIAKIK